MNETFAVRLQKLRERRGISRRVLSERCDSGLSARPERKFLACPIFWAPCGRGMVA